MFCDVQQNTDEWLQMRVGKITGSGVSKFMANFGKAFGQPAVDYSIQIAIEQLTGKAYGNSYSNGHMERGHEQEPIARTLYEEAYFCDVSNGGFFDNGLTGCSPDGLIYGDGLIEIKSVIGTVHFDTVKRGKFDPKYKWQLAFNLMETGRNYIDYVSYSADFPSGKRLFVYRCNRETFKDEFDMILTRKQEFMELVEKNKQVILS
jgi:hypothetical protein